MSGARTLLAIAVVWSGAVATARAGDPQWPNGQWSNYLQGPRKPCEVTGVASSGLTLSPSLCGPGRHPRLMDRTAQIRELKDSMVRALDQTTPNIRFEGPADHAETRLFSGNVDWHSSVHNHWALLSMARLTQDTDLEKKLMARFTPGALAEEGRLLNSGSPKDELPYGQSWLLLMLEELGRRPAGRTSEALALRAQTEERVLSYLEKSPLFEDTFNRDYAPWLFSYLLLKMSHPSSMNAARFQALQARVDSNRAAILHQTYSKANDDFLFQPAVLALVDYTPPVRPNPSAYRYPPLPFPDRPVNDSNSHQPGALMVSLWPHAAQAGRGDEKACRLFNGTLNRIFSVPEYWRNDPANAETFDTVGHWVPQFIWMAIVFEQGPI